MTQEDKELLLKDISARLPYGLILRIAEHNVKITANNTWVYFGASDEAKEHIKPYLRPLDSITEEEEKNFNQIFDLELKVLEDTTVGHSIESAASSTFMIDFYNKHHFDYRGLIPKGLAIEVTEDNNPYET